MSFMLTLQSKNNSQRSNKNRAKRPTSMVGVNGLELAFAPWDASTVQVFFVDNKNGLGERT